MPHQSDLSRWNDAMYVAHPTPYQNPMAGIIERERVKIITQMCRVGKKDRVLEIGCEQGTLLEALPDGREKVGVDISAVALKDAKRRLGDKARFICGDAQEKIKLPNESFDVVVCSQTLEHVKYPEKMMENIKRLVTKKGRVVISVPNEVFMFRMKQFLKKIGVLQWLFPGIEEGVSEWHLQVFTDQKVRGLVEKDFEIIEHKRAFNVYLIYLLKKK